MLEWLTPVLLSAVGAQVLHLSVAWCPGAPLALTPTSLPVP